MTHTTTSNMNIKANRNDHTLLLNYALKKFLTLSPDITIVAKDGQLQVNRLLLCMYSPTISSAISQCSSTESIFLPDFPVASVWILIDLLIFGFSSRVDLTADWFQNVLDIAKILQIQIKKQNVQVIDSEMCFEQTDMATKTRKTSETNHSKDVKVDDATILNDSITEVKLPSTIQRNSCEDSHDSENNTEDTKWEKDRTIYEVTCKDSKGEFHLDKFSGGKGLCVFFGGTWMTPGIFEKMAGSKAKNYKKSLQVNGTPIKNLIDPYGIGLVIPSPKQNKSINLSRGDGESITTEEPDEVSNAIDEVSNATDEVFNPTGLAEPSVQQKPSTNLNSVDDHLNSVIRLNDEDNIKVVENDVYEVTCKESRGEFHRQKFISGGKGLCILFNGNWMTPNDFERLAGSKGKKYKETLHVDGKPLKLLIEIQDCATLPTDSISNGDLNYGNEIDVKVEVVEEYGEKSVYLVRCKESWGEFHHEKFDSGSKGLCILFNGNWMTPNDFERLAGSKGKKYKETLHVDGKPLKLLIDPCGTKMATPSLETRQFRNLNNVEMTAKMGDQKHLNSVEMTAKMGDQKHLNSVEMTAKMGDQKHLNSVEMTAKMGDQKHLNNVEMTAKIGDQKHLNNMEMTDKMGDQKHLNSVEMTAKMGDQKHLNSVEMTAKMEDKKHLNNVEMTAKMGNKKLFNVVKGETFPVDNSEHVTPRLKKQENILDKDYNRNSISTSIGEVNMKGEMMADISNTAHTKKRKRQSNEPSSDRKSKSKKMKLDVMQESSIKDEEVARSPLENEELNLSSSQVKIKAKAELKDYGDARTEDKSLGSSKNVNKKNKIAKEVYETNEWKCECGAILKNALLLKFHKSEDCETYT